MKTYHGLLLLPLLLTACSHIGEDERFIEVKPANVVKAVLVEEFTGQRCVNCPNAAIEIERLREQYGDAYVIPVAIHSGPLALDSNDKVLGLRTQLGDEYYDHWKVEAEPTGMIDRKGGVVNLSQWASAVYEELQKESPVSLSIGVKMANGQEQVTSQSVVEVSVEATIAEPTEGYLQLWMTEDSIVAPQMMPDGTMNREYVHNHVLRAAVNGTWGTPVSWKPGVHSQTFSFSIDPTWKKDNLSVVAFVYNEQGVLQVKSQQLVVSLE